MPKFRHRCPPLQEIMNLLPIIIATVVIAFFTGSDALFYLTYALIAILLLSRWLPSHVLTNIHVVRHFTPRAFYGEQAVVNISVTNRGRLPVPWLHVHESIPIALHIPNFERRAVSLAPGERVTLSYVLNCSQRGYYHLGPLQLRTGDFFGVAPECQVDLTSDPFIVYPRIIPLRRLPLPSQLPFGSIAERRRIFQDPSRYFGLRDYQPSDSQRQINWKSSARTDQLQVKRFQPAIALDTMIFLDLNSQAYNVRSVTTASEMGIVIAASFAAHLIEQRQQVGLTLLAKDAVTDFVGLQTIRPSHGREHLMHVLEVLARADLAVTPALASLLPPASANLSWGSTAIVITPGNDSELLPALLQLQRQGLALLVVVTDAMAGLERLQDRLHQVGIPSQWVTEDREMDIWR